MYKLSSFGPTFALKVGGRLIRELTYIQVYTVLCVATVVDQCIGWQY